MASASEEFASRVRKKQQTSSHLEAITFDSLPGATKRQEYARGNSAFRCL
jgi:hypothetical protein